MDREVKAAAERFLDALRANGYSVREAMMLIRDVANELLEKWEKEDHLPRRP